jgi:hypothetical protein
VHRRSDLFTLEEHVAKRQPRWRCSDSIEKTDVLQHMHSRGTHL